jgi:hypothetical protein
MVSIVFKRIMVRYIFSTNSCANLKKKKLANGLICDYITEAIFYFPNVTHFYRTHLSHSMAFHALITKKELRTAFITVCCLAGWVSTILEKPSVSILTAPIHQSSWCNIPIDHNTDKPPP